MGRTIGPRECAAGSPPTGANAISPRDGAPWTWHPVQLHWPLAPEVLASTGAVPPWPSGPRARTSRRTARARTRPTRHRNGPLAPGRPSRPARPESRHSTRSRRPSRPRCWLRARRARPPRPRPGGPPDSRPLPFAAPPTRTPASRSAARTCRGSSSPVKRWAWSRLGEKTSSSGASWPNSARFAGRQKTFHGSQRMCRQPAARRRAIHSRSGSGASHSRRAPLAPAYSAGNSSGRGHMAMNRSASVRSTWVRRPSGSYSCQARGDGASRLARLRRSNARASFRRSGSGTSRPRVARRATRPLHTRIPIAACVAPPPSVPMRV